ncbi:MAG: mechanosensitive ion channel [Flavobacteriales bacterium]|nr:mechanosensitive ion channel [Flavobacteriales bacterium]
MNDLKIEEYAQRLITQFVDHLPQLVLAVLLLFGGLWLIRMLMKGMGKAMQARNVDPSLTPFLKSMLGALLKVILIISVIQMIGIQTTSFIAVLGAAGLAIGMALSGTLQNFAGGVMLLIVKPFKVGDFIEAQGHSGTVHQIRIFNTILRTPDNKTVVLPNAPVSTGALVNYTTEAQRRVDLEFGIGYGDDIDLARATIQQVLDTEERILNDKPTQIVVAELADSSVNFKVRVWVENSNYWPVFFALQEAVKKAFDERGVSIPFPQMDVHVQGAN